MRTALCLGAVLLLAPLAQPQQLTTTTFNKKRYTVCRVDLSRQRLGLYWRDGRKQPYGGFSALEAALRRQGRRLVFAMNAGMFQPDLSPVGLYVERGKQLHRLNLAKGKGNFCLLPNGVFALTRSGARIVTTPQYPALAKSVTLATQSGPMLVIDGRLHPAFRQGSTSRLIRNGVGVVSPRQVVFAIAEEPVNFHEFALLFRDGLSCRNALYLDGNVSSLYSTKLRRNDAWSRLGPMLGVWERAR